ncbi:ABC transporter substrate-binding protein [Methylocapsa sp. S129]|uniref:ABC transporter substrate-binding protein n=1 Tax=Methylocapsa sp. S129 TaxID=1641869 RepID=UPI00131DA6A3|nr:ABC transporter substrate-binding protein [Methylocapsa sp. S129]
MISRRTLLQAGAVSAAALASGLRPARAANAVGVTEAEIKIGQTMPYSGPASAYGVIGKADVAYFKMINEAGGINGRKLNLISLDDGYSPPKTVEQTRRLVEQEQVAFIFNSLGTPSNAAIRPYLTENKVPQLFVATGAAMWNDPKNFPWTIGWQPNYQTEASIFGKHIVATKPGAKIGVLYQNDAFGKDYLTGLKAGLGADHAGLIIKEASYEVSEPTVDSQIVSLQDSGADVLLIAATPKFAAQAIRKTFDIGWTPVRYMTDVSLSIASVMKPAGLEKSKGVITANYGKDPTDARWKDDEGYKGWAAFVAKYLTPADLIDSNAIYGYGVAATMVQVLKQCENDLSRENIMRQAANIKDLELPMLLPGVKINTSPDNFAPIRQEQLESFNGESWSAFGDLLQG